MKKLVDCDSSVDQNSDLCIEPYIDADSFFSQFLISIITSFLNFFILFFSVGWIEQQLNWGLTNNCTLILIIVSSCGLSSIALFSEKIVRRLSKSWKYPRFRFLQFIANAITWVILGVLSIMSIIAHFNDLSLWQSLLVLILFDIYFYLMFYRRFISTLGEAILSLNSFLVNAETDVESINFEDLLFSLKKVNKIAKKYNICISPKQLATAITTSFFKNKQRSLEEINEIVNWLRNQTHANNFNSFCKVINAYTKDAKICEQGGLINDGSWTFEKLAKILAVIVPLLSAFLTIVIPIILREFFQITI